MIYETARQQRNKEDVKSNKDESAVHNLKIDQKAEMTKDGGKDGLNVRYSTAQCGTRSVIHKITQKKSENVDKMKEKIWGATGKYHKARTTKRKW